MLEQTISPKAWKLTEYQQGDYYIAVCEEYLLIDAHHILSDGTSMSVLGDAIRDAYQGIPILPELLVPSVQSQLEQQDEEKAREALAYFTKELGGVEVDSNLPVDLPDATSSLQGNLLKMKLDVPFDTVEQIARQFDVTKGTIFLTAFAYALAKTTCQTESLFCTVSSGRHHDPLLSHTVGMFVRTLPFYMKFDEDGRIEDQLKAARRELSAAIKHDCVSFAALSKELGLRSDMNVVCHARDQPCLFSCPPSSNISKCNR